jgi:hypothetical protein
MEQTAVVWVLYEITASPLLLGLVGVFRAAPFTLLSSFAGAVSDRVDQRKLLFATQGAGLVASLVLGVLVASGGVQVWQIYLQVAVQSAISAFDTAARQSLFPRLVPRAEIPASVTLNSTAARSSALVGPAIAGLLIARTGEATPMFVNAGTFLLLLGAVALIRDVVPRVAAVGSSVRAEMLQGLRFILRSPVLVSLIKLEGAFALLSVNSVIIAIVARQALHTGPEGLGQLLAAPALGALLAIAMLLWFGPARQQGRFLYASAATYVLGVLAFAISTNFVLSMAALALVGLCDCLVSIGRASILQMAAPPAMRGRVMANALAVNRGLGPLAQTQSGAVAGLIGGPFALVGAAIVLGLAIGTNAVRNPLLRSFKATEVHVAVPEARPNQA